MGLPNDLPIYTVYDKTTSDHPGMYVVRVWRVFPGGKVPVPDQLTYAMGTSLSAIRRSLPSGLTRIDRHPSDDPVILETWI